MRKFAEKSPVIIAFIVMLAIMALYAFKLVERNTIEKQQH